MALVTSGCGQVARSVFSGAENACLVLAGSTTREVKGVNRIIGAVRNDCDRRFLTVNIVFRLYRSSKPGAAGMPEPAAVATVRDLEPGQTKEFETLPVGRDAAFRLERISGF